MQTTLRQANVYRKIDFVYIQDQISISSTHPVAHPVTTINSRNLLQKFNKYDVKNIMLVGVVACISLEPELN